ncbi:hypothetical protein PR048_021223 [Dryococelus australis]|uniref:Uncharacterized protein n=1 Tax=Dryococelus australis TaxID=614101 RepID=A0ABQ9GXM9_9NEOP|nr:hypothetical protein PR048_021223 [Dryococelus australis]
MLRETAGVDSMLFNVKVENLTNADFIRAPVPDGTENPAQCSNLHRGKRLQGSNSHQQARHGSPDMTLETKQPMKCKIDLTQARQILSSGQQFWMRKDLHLRGAMPQLRETPTCLLQLRSRLSSLFLRLENAPMHWTTHMHAVCTHASPHSIVCPCPGMGSRYSSGLNEPQVRQQPGDRCPSRTEAANISPFPALLPILTIGRGAGRKTLIRDPFPRPCIKFLQVQSSSNMGIHQQRDTCCRGPRGMEQRRNERAGEREFPEKTRRPAVSPGTIPTYENPGVTRLGIELGSLWWENLCSMAYNIVYGLQDILRAAAKETELTRAHTHTRTPPDGTGPSYPTTGPEQQERTPPPSHGSYCVPRQPNQPLASARRVTTSAVTNCKEPTSPSPNPLHAMAVDLFVVARRRLRRETSSDRHYLKRWLAMTEYTFADSTDMMLISGEVKRYCRDSYRLYQERFLHRIIATSEKKNGCRKQAPSMVTGPTVMLHEGAALSTSTLELKRIGRQALEPLRLPQMSLIAVIYTIAWKCVCFQSAFFPPMKDISPGKLFSTVETAPFGMKKTLVSHIPKDFNNGSASMCEQTFEEMWVGLAEQPRSLDITPLNFFVWGHMKGVVYETSPSIIGISDCTFCGCSRRDSAYTGHYRSYVWVYASLIQYVQITSFPPHRTAVVVNVVWSSAGMQGRGKREISEKTHRIAASSGTIPTCENPGVTRPEIELGSPWWKADSLTVHSPRHSCKCVWLGLQDPTRVKRGEYGAAPECKSRENGRSRGNIVQHNSQQAKIWGLGATPPWWVASSLTTSPPWLPVADNGSIPGPAMIFQINPASPWPTASPFRTIRAPGCVSDDCCRRDCKELRKKFHLPSPTRTSSTWWVGQRDRGDEEPLTRGGEMFLPQPTQGETNPARRRPVMAPHLVPLWAWHVLWDG